MSSAANHFESWKRDAIVAVAAGGLIAISIGGVSLVLGQISGAEARRLVEATIPTSRLFCSSLMAVSATILALMLTMIGLCANANATLSDSHYHRVLTLGLYDAILFAASTFLFVVHCVPVFESETIPSWWYSSIYYGLLAATSALAGGSVAIIALLYLAVRDIIQVVGLKVEDHRMLESDKSGEQN